MYIHTIYVFNLIDTLCNNWFCVFLGANVRLRIFEAASMMQHMIDSFNINTNAWVMHYVYKRLRFLNNKHMSQFGALVCF